MADGACRNCRHARALHETEGRDWCVSYDPTWGEQEWSTCGCRDYEPRERIPVTESDGGDVRRCEYPGCDVVGGEFAIVQATTPRRPVDLCRHHGQAAPRDLILDLASRPRPDPVYGEDAEQQSLPDAGRDLGLVALGLDDLDLGVAVRVGRLDLDLGLVVGDRHGAGRVGLGLLAPVVLVGHRGLGGVDEGELTVVPARDVKGTWTDYLVLHGEAIRRAWEKREQERLQETLAEQLKESVAADVGVDPDFIKITVDTYRKETPEYKVRFTFDQQDVEERVG